MKVVLFCGGTGIRLQEYSERIPKPLVPVGNRPMIWHVMKYYAHFGHRDFILCLGYKGDEIKNYFMKYKEYLSNDFILRAGSNIDLFERDIHDWNITFADTGLYANIAERLLAVKKYLKGENAFLVNYADGLTDLHLPDMIQAFQKSGKVGMLMVTRPRKDLRVTSIEPTTTEGAARVTSVNKLDEVWFNAGYYIFRKEIFRHIDPDGDLLEYTFPRLVALSQLMAYPYDGMFIAMDTFKEKQALDDMYDRGDTPWQVWKGGFGTPQDVDRSDTLDQLNYSAR
ncbi:MAG TPA: sugar phosphate nucleotidyltransferase [Cyclobacteriaceae bacterium]